MRDGLPIAYATTRAAARLAWRPGARLWQRLHAARDLRALLDAARAAPVGAYLSGVAGTDDAAAIDAAFRAQLRARVAETAGWAPPAWRAALQWTALLIDLPAVAALWRGEPARWMHADPVLGPYAGSPARDGRPPTPAALRTALTAGPLGPLGRALHARELGALARHDGRPRAAVAPMSAALPAVLQAWCGHWRSLWPAAAGSAERAALAALEHEALAHRARFASLPAGDAQGARDALADRVRARLRRAPTRPVALFAWLLLLALDLERLRAEAIGHALQVAEAA